MSAVVETLCTLLGVLLAAAVLYGCEPRAGVTRPTRVRLEPPNPASEPGSTNPHTSTTMTTTASATYDPAMADLTDDPADPRLTHGVDATPTPQAEAYLVLSAEERAREFVRPLRRTYVHVGPGGAEVDPNDPRKHGRTLSVLGDLACGAATRMSRALAETYARDPSFYNATYCVGCQRHLPVAEFVWADDTDQVVGS